MFDLTETKATKLHECHTVIMPHNDNDQDNIYWKAMCVVWANKGRTVYDRQKRPVLRVVNRPTLMERIINGSE